MTSTNPIHPGGTSRNDGDPAVAAGTAANPSFLPCDDCGEAEQPRRRRCKHCYLLVCWWCLSHVHQCAPSHELKDCRDKNNLKKPRAFLEQMRRRVMARELVLHGTQEGKRTV